MSISIGDVLHVNALFRKLAEKPYARMFSLQGTAGSNGGFLNLPGNNGEEGKVHV